MVSAMIRMTQHRKNLGRVIGGLVVGLLILTILTSLGCKTTQIHVDAKNSQGPWDGSVKHPYKTIQEGLNKAKKDQGDTVVVHGGVYNENLVMKTGTTLMRAKANPTVVVQGKAGAPTISSNGLNHIYDLLIEGGSVGVEIELGTVLKTYPNALTFLSDNIIESPTAIRVKTASNLSFGKKVRKVPTVAIESNWIRNPVGQGKTGTGILVDLIGPKTGELGLRMKIQDNLFQNKVTGIDLTTTGQGPNPGHFVRADIIGEIASNLIYGGVNGIRMHGKNLGNAGILIFNNSIVNNESHAIVATADSGPDGQSTTHPDVRNNIVAGNKGIGYYESGSHTSALDLNHNIFHKNTGGHYYDNETGQFINSKTGLNTPIVQNKVVFYSGGGNLVTDPRFEKGVLLWNGKSWSGEKVGAFFLTQKGPKKSPGIDAGLGTAHAGGLSLKTTSKDYTKDVGTADIGFHYTK